MAGLDERRLLVLSNVWVEPNASAAGWRMLRLIERFLSEGFQVAYASTAGPSEIAYDLGKKGVSTHQVVVNDDAFDAFLLEQAPDVVLFDRFMVEEQFGWRLAKVLPNCVRVLDTEDLHGLRYAREAALNDGRSFQPSDLHREIMFRELAAMHRCDLTLVISSFEYYILRDHFKLNESILHYLPFHLDKGVLDEVPNQPSFSERSNFITIGNFRHAPNRDAVQVLKDRIWPRIRSKMKHPVELHVYGAYADHRAKAWHRPEEGFHIKGFASDLEHVLKDAKVLLAPLRFGAGLKGKLVDAMRFGLPSITTTIGAEGIANQDEWPGFVLDDLDAFADKAVHLYDSKEDWLASVKRIPSVLKAAFMDDRYEEKFIECLQEIQHDPEAHRQGNWIGGMLQLNSQKSYTYLSKWIMEKQRSNHPR